METAKKILMVSMPSIHFFRWTEQLKNTGFEIYWFDSVGSGQKVEKLNWIQQFVDWKLRWNYLGRIFIKKNIPFLYTLIQKINERDIAKEFEKVVKQVQPDVVHSFALYVSCTPILKVMMKYKSIKWIYSSWGSDLFYFKNNPVYLNDIKNVLPRINYLITDCNRDYKLAIKYGFKGEFLGVFPGGGGFDLEQMSIYLKPLKERDIILIKGYEGRSGRAINVLKAIERLKVEVESHKIIVFGADTEVFEYAQNTGLINWKNFMIYGKIPRNEVLAFMGKSLIYIGNSNSDGVPNTLLESICLGVFPIQSNPGRATEEVIVDGKNGFLIMDFENNKEIESLLLKVLSDSKLVESAFMINQKELKYQFGREKIKQNVFSKYTKIENDLKDSFDTIKM